MAKDILPGEPVLVDITDLYYPDSDREIPPFPDVYQIDYRHSVPRIGELSDGSFFLTEFESEPKIFVDDEESAGILRGYVIDFDDCTGVTECLDAHSSDLLAYECLFDKESGFEGPYTEEVNKISDIQIGSNHNRFLVFQSIYVEPSCRKKGLTKILFDDALEWYGRYCDFIALFVQPLPYEHRKRAGWEGDYSAFEKYDEETSVKNLKSHYEKLGFVGLSNHNRVMICKSKSAIKN